jgi:hypothetical protein
VPPTKNHQAALGHGLSFSTTGKPSSLEFWDVGGDGSARARPMRPCKTTAINAKRPMPVGRNREITTFPWWIQAQLVCLSVITRRADFAGMELAAGWTATGVILPSISSRAGKPAVKTDPMLS